MGSLRKYFWGKAPTEVVAMVDASFSRQKQQEDRVAAVRRQLSVFAAGLVLILIGLGCVLLVRGLGGNNPPVVPSAATANELLETTKALQATQQQAVDQLQVVQDQLFAQKEDSRRLSEQVATLTEKLQALQQSLANISAPGSSPKSNH